MDAKAAADSRAEITHLMGLTDANNHGNELVTFRATVNAAWRTSMEVGVRVEAENPMTGSLRHTNTAYLTMVALDDGGAPSPIPPVLAVTPTETRRMREAELRRANRLAEREEIVARRTLEARRAARDDAP